MISFRLLYLYNAFPTTPIQGEVNVVALAIKHQIDFCLHIFNVVEGCEISYDNVSIQLKCIKVFSYPFFYNKSVTRKNLIIFLGWQTLVASN